MQHAFDAVEPFWGASFFFVCPFSTAILLGVPGDESMAMQLCIQPEYESLLRAAKLSSVDDFMRLPGTVVRSMPGRTTRRIEVRRPDGPVLSAFLKCQEPGRPPWWRRWISGFNPGHAARKALIEWRNIQELRRRGFQTAEPIAAGWQRSPDNGELRSFVLTAEILDAMYSLGYWRAGTALQRRRLIRRIADLARRFHQAGFIHRDFYLVHLFVAEREGDVDLTMIDLHRVMGPGSFLTRWRVKDIGSLMFSLEREGTPRATILRLFKLYRGAGRSTAADRLFLWRALRRAAWLRGRTPKYGPPKTAG
jgi:hypothetical protein